MNDELAWKIVDAINQHNLDYAIYLLNQYGQDLNQIKQTSLSNWTETDKTTD